MKEIELIDKRKNREKHFLQENGEIIARMYEEPIHFLKNGKYEEINNTLILKDDYYINQNNAYKVWFGLHPSDDFMQMETLDYYLNIRLKTHGDFSIQKNTNKSILEDRICYKNILENMDLDYQVLATKVKESIVLHNKNANINELEFIIRTNMELNIIDDKRICASKDGNTIFYMDAPYMYDSNDIISHNVHYLLEKKEEEYVLRLVVDQDWLNNLNITYPVVIDPTIVGDKNENSVYDTYIYPEDTGVDRNNRAYLKVGVEKVNGVDVINRSLIKFDLPVLGTGSYITHAQLELTGYPDFTNSLEQDFVNIYRVTEDWNESTANWNTMNNKYDSSRIEGTFESNRNYFQENGVISPFGSSTDITSLVQKWYTGTPNYGIMLKANTEQYRTDIIPMFFSKNNTVTGDNPKPILEITYRNQNGLESYMDYNQQSFSQGSTYHNTYNGNLTGVFDIGATIGGKLPVGLKLVYNTNDVVLNQNLGYGIGYRLNLLQTIQEEEIDNRNYLAYVDEDGTIHYFLNQKVKYEQNENGSSGFVTTTYENTYFDEDGLGLEIEKSTNTYIMKDKNGNQKKFVKSGKYSYLTEIKDVSGNKISITYDTNHRITKVVDANNQAINLTYGVSAITVTSPDQVVTLNHENCNITSIVSIQGTTTLTYSNNLISSITDVTGKKLEYTYYEQSPYKVKKITEYGLNNTMGTFYEVTYGFNATTITDSKNKVQTIVYNSYGNPISMSSLKDHNDITNAYGMKLEYGESIRGVNTYSNKLLENQIPLKYVKNYIKDSSFEKMETEFIAEGASHVVTSSDYANSGNRSLKVQLGTGAYQGAYKEIEVSKGKYYTLSAYVKALYQPMLLGLYYMDNNGTMVITFSDNIKQTSQAGAFERHDVTIFYPSDATSNLYIGFFEGDLYYIDDIQLEEGQVANNYNMIENSDFSEGLSSWDLSATKFKDDTDIPVADVFEIINVTDNQKALKVSMNPEVSSTFSKTFNVKGKAGDIYTLSFWYKNEGLVAGEGMYYGTYNNIIFGFIPVAEFGTDDVYIKPFNPNEKEWQYYSCTFTAPFDFKEINMSFLQSMNANNFYITNINLFKDVRSVTYDYDENGNVILSKNLNKDSSSFKYDKNNQLIGMFDPKGKNFTFEYDNIVTDRVLKGVSETGISNEVEYDSFGNPRITRIVNRGQETYVTEETYRIRLKGTEKYIRLIDNSISLVEDLCNHDSWIFDTILTGTHDYFRISHSIISQKYLTLSDNKLEFIDNNNEYSLFTFIKNENGSYCIQCKANNLYLYNDNNSLHFKELEKGNYNFEFYLEALTNSVLYTDPVATAEFIENSCEYTEDGKYIKSITDTRMHKTSYDIDTTTGLLNSITNAKNQTTNYVYNDKRQLTGITTKDRSVGYTYNNQNLLSEITQQDRVYHFIYDNFLNMKSVKIGDNITLITNNYEENNGNLVSSIYGNDDSITYEYDEFDRIKKVNKMNDTYEYFYGNNGDLLKIKSNENTIKYTYDSGKRLYKYCNNNFKITYGYDSNDNIISKKYVLNGTEYTEVVNTFNKDDALTKVQIFGDLGVSYYYDNLGRLDYKSLNHVIPIFYEYLTNGRRTSLLINKIKIENDVYSYKYDKLDNITHIYYNGVLENRYYYDDYNELIKEDNYILNKTIKYTYDSLGNLLSKKVYELGTNNLVAQDSYQYNNSNWKDQLTKFNNDIITYDAIGNPLTIGENITLDWVNGRQLNQYVDANNTVEYQYNKDGIRTSKTINNVKTEYYVEGTSIIFEKTGNDVLYYIRNEVDGLVGFKYNDATYYYIKNNQNDIIAILDNLHNYVAKYTYDAWGNIISITDSDGNDISNDDTHIGNINPFRYRSYYYDRETNLYYLNSRYYNPVWGRFLNCDNYINSNKDIISHNLYVYCSNNPIINSDVTGFGIIKSIINIGKNISNSLKNVEKEVQKIAAPQTLPNYTKVLDKTLIRNVAQATIIKNSVSPPSSMNYFYQKEKSKGDWDYKLEKNWERDIDAPFLGATGQFLYNGEITTAEDFGNIHYAIIGSQMGYSPTLLYIGGGFAKCGISIRIFEPPYYCDDKNDHEWIKKGIDMYYSGK